MGKTVSQATAGQIALSSLRSYRQKGRVFIQKTLLRRLDSSRIWNEFIYGGHLLSIGASSITALPLILLGRPLEIPLVLIPYFLSQIVYSYDHLKEEKTDDLTNPDRNQYLKEAFKKFPYYFFAYCAGLVITLITLASIRALLFVMFAVSTGLLYTLVLKNVTRRITAFKNIYVSFSWGLLALLPAYEYLLAEYEFFFLVFIFVGCRLMVNTVYFDFKDQESDGMNGLKSIPVTYGKEGTLRLVSVLNVLSALPLAFGILSGILPAYSALLILFCFYSMFYIKKAAKVAQQSIRLLSYRMVDGEYALWPVVLLAGKLFI